MGINWHNVIRDQARGIDPVTAFNRESRRIRKENEKRFRQQVERRAKSR